MLRPTGSGHDAVLYTHQRNSKETDAFFRSRNGELWVGRTHTLAEKSTELGIETAPLGELGTTLAGSRAGPHPGAARAGRQRSTGRCWPTSPTRTSRATASWPGCSPSSSWSRTSGRSPSCRPRSTRPCAASRTSPGCCRPTAAVKERLLEGVFGLRARHDGNDVGLRLDRRRRRARDDPALGAQHRRDHARRAAAHGHGRRGRQLLHRRRDPHGPGLRHVHAAAAAGLRHRVRVAAGRHGRHQAGRAVPRRAPDLHAGPRRGAARPRPAAGQRRRGDERRQHDLPPVDAARLRPHARHRRARLLERPQARTTATARSARATC